MSTISSKFALWTCISLFSISGVFAATSLGVIPVSPGNFITIDYTTQVHNEIKSLTGSTKRMEVKNERAFSRKEKQLEKFLSTKVINETQVIRSVNNLIAFFDTQKQLIANLNTLDEQSKETLLKALKVMIADTMDTLDASNLSESITTDTIDKLDVEDNDIDNDIDDIDTDNDEMDDESDNEEDN